MIPEPTEKPSQNENTSESTGGGFNQAENINDQNQREGSQDIDNLPVESIGSYARLDDLLTDEEKENTTTTKTQS